MAIFLGDNQITSIKLGDADVLSVCLGDNLVWQGGVTPTGVFALKFTNPGSSSVELFILKQSSPTANLTKDDFEMSTDGGDTWTTPSGDSYNPVRQEIQAGQEILFRRKGSGYLSDSSGYYQLGSNGPLLVSGPIRALLGDSDATAPHEVGSQCFRDFYAGSYLSAELDFGGITSAQSGAFYNFNSYNVSTLTVKNLENDLSAESTSFQQAFRQAQYGSDELRLSGLHLSRGGFQSMFEGNPNLRSVRLSVEDVYADGNGNPMESMFKNCSALEDVEISCNPQGMSFTNGYEMVGILQGCPNLKSVVVRGLSGVGNGTGTLQGAFQNCNSISSVSFPDLVQPYGQGYNGRYAFLNAFNSVSSMKELRFGAGTEGDVTRLESWNTTFGMTQYGREHCSVYCGDHMLKPYDSWAWKPDTYIYKTNSTKSEIPLFTFEGNTDYPEFYMELSGDAGGDSYIGFNEDDNADYRFFNAGGAGSYYMDCGSARTSGSGPSINGGFIIVSAWNCGWWVSAGMTTASSDTTPTGDTLSGVIRVGCKNTTMMAIGKLSVFQGGTLTHSYVPINDTTNGPGLSDTVDGTTHFPETQGVWAYVET